MKKNLLVSIAAVVLLLASVFLFVMSGIVYTNVADYCGVGSGFVPSAASWEERYCAGYFQPSFAGSAPAYALFLFGAVLVASALKLAFPLVRIRTRWLRLAVFFLLTFGVGYLGFLLGQKAYGLSLWGTAFWQSDLRGLVGWYLRLLIF